MKTGRFASLYPLWLFLLCFCFPGFAFAQHYVITDLGTLPGGTFSQATGLNDFGQVVGTGDITGEGGAFLWTKAKGMQSLGSLFCCSWANAINDLGHVTGGSWVSESDNGAYLWTAEGGMQEVFYVNVGQGGFAINNHDEIGGSYSAEPPLPFVWTKKSGPLSLKEFSNGGVVMGINDRGQAVGWYDNLALGNRAFLLSQSAGLRDLGAGQANAINYLGNVVGANGADHAFFWNNGAGMQDMGTLSGDESSYAAAINLFDVVVGTSIGNDGSRAFLWSKGTGMIDLNTLIPTNSGWTLYDATGINITGQIIGNGMINGQYHAFLLTLK